MENRDYRIIGDSCCDYTEELDLGFIHRVPLTIELGGREYVDNEALDCDMLVREMAACPEAPKSACPTPGAFAGAIGEYDEAYIVTLSANVSGTYGSAVLGAEMAREAKPGRRVHVFNSRSAAAGEVAICCKIRQLVSEGLSFERVVEKTEEYISGMNTFFVLETLEVFRKNGRLTHLQSIATAALRLRMIMGASSEGEIVVRGKALSMARALKGMVEQVKEKVEQRLEGHEELFITHCACRERAEEVREMLRRACPSLKRITILRSSGISTMYANAGGIIVSF